MKKICLRGYYSELITKIIDTNRSQSGPQHISVPRQEADIGTDKGLNTNVWPIAEDKPRPAKSCA